MAEITKTVGLTITGIDLEKGAKDGTGFVYLTAIGADETPDIDGEIFDYNSSKPFIEQWSDDFAARTKAAGQTVSYGNVRAQHGSQGAQNVAGTVCEPILFEDKQKAVHLAVKVVDADAITKVREGAYTGMSIKGKLIGKMWPDGKYWRYTVAPIEWTICDKPANPNATITVIKADGSTEILERDKTLVEKAAALVAEMSLAEIRETQAMTTEIEKGAKKGAFEKAKAAHEKMGDQIDELGDHLAGKCKCAGMAKCAEKMAGCAEKIKAAHESMGAHMDTDGSDETDGAEKSATAKVEIEVKTEKPAPVAASVEKSADVIALEGTVKTLTDQMASLSEVVKAAMEGKGLARPVPILNGSTVHTRPTDDEKDLTVRKAAIKDDDPHRIDKAYQIDRSAEPELVKLL